MSVANSDLVIYVAASMPEDNTSTAGGAIDSGVRASFDDPSSSAKAIMRPSRSNAAEGFGP